MGSAQYPAFLRRVATQFEGSMTATSLRTVANHLEHRPAVADKLRDVSNCPPDTSLEHWLGILSQFFEAHTEERQRLQTIVGNLESLLESPGDSVKLHFVRSGSVVFVIETDHYGPYITYGGNTIADALANAVKIKANVDAAKEVRP